MNKIKEGLKEKKLTQIWLAKILDIGVKELLVSHKPEQEYK